MICLYDWTVILHIRCFQNFGPQIIIFFNIFANFFISFKNSLWIWIQNFESHLKKIQLNIGLLLIEYYILCYEYIILISKGCKNLKLSCDDKMISRLLFQSHGSKVEKFRIAFRQNLESNQLDIRTLKLFKIELRYFLLL